MFRRRRPLAEPTHASPHSHTHTHTNARACTHTLLTPDRPSICSSNTAAAHKENLHFTYSPTCRFFADYLLCADLPLGVEELRTAGTRESEQRRRRPVRIRGGRSTRSQQVETSRWSKSTHTALSFLFANPGLSRLVLKKIRHRRGTLWLLVFQHHPIAPLFSLFSRPRRRRPRCVTKC